VLAATLFSMAVSPWLDEPPMILVFSEWAVLVTALIVGTWFGNSFVSRPDQLADA